MIAFSDRIRCYQDKTAAKKVCDLILVSLEDLPDHPALDEMFNRIYDRMLSFELFGWLTALEEEL